jgi:hypothetical protein
MMDTPDDLLTWCGGLVLLLAIVVGVNCQGYAGSMRSVRSSFANNDPDRALAQLNTQLGTDTSREPPASLEGSSALTLLERATLLQALNQYNQSANDLITADNRLEYLDLSSADSLELGKYLYSERATTYRAPAFERLALNALNMLNFLAINDYQGARVEARRFDLIDQFFVKHDDQVIRRHLRALGYYLGGISFERGGDYHEAARYYGRAYYFGFRSRDLKQRLIDLYRITGYQPGELRARDPGALDELTSAARDGAISVNEYRKRYLSGGDTLLVVQTGMVPYRDTRQVRVNRAISIARGARYSHLRLSAGDASRFRSIALGAGITAIPFPGLTQGETPPNRNTSLRIDALSSESLNPFAHVNLALQAEQAWNDKKGTLMVAAITRFLARLTAAGVTKHQVEQNTGSSGWGFLAGLATYITLQALDQPDTRSWMTLPGEIKLYRTSLSPGERQIRLDVGAKRIERTVSINGKQLNVINFSRHR